MSEPALRIVRNLSQWGEQHADPNDDLIPLGTSTMPPAGKGIEPIRPGLRRARVVADPDRSGQWRYVFHPREQYGPNWLTQHEMRYAQFLRKATVDFARSVAGGVNRKLTDLLETGFEDITHIMRDATARHELALYGRASSQPSDELGDVTEETQRELAALTELVRSADERVTARDIALMMHSLTLRNQRHEYAVVRWMTLPYNMHSVYFKPQLKTAVEYALEQIHSYNPAMEESMAELFSELIGGPRRTDFVKLVVLNLRKIYYASVGGYNRTFAEGRQLDEDLANAAKEFASYFPEPAPSEAELASAQRLTRQPLTFGGSSAPSSSFQPTNPI